MLVVNEIKNFFRMNFQRIGNALDRYGGNTYDAALDPADLMCGDIRLQFKPLLAKAFGHSERS